MDQETIAEYIPEPGDVVKWMKSYGTNGSARGVVDFIVSHEEKTCKVYVPTYCQYGTPSRYLKRFDQLELLERPMSDREA